MSDHIVDPYEIVHWGLSHSGLREKTGQKLFFTGKFAFFFQSLCFQQPLRFYSNDLVTSTVNVRSPSGPLWIIPWGRSHSIMPEKIGQNLFFTGKIAFFFQSLCFQHPFRFYRNDLVTSTVIVKSPCGPLWIIPWGVSHSIIGEQLGHKLFFTGKFAFFFKKLCFQQLLQCSRNDLATSTVVVKKPCGFL